MVSRDASALFLAIFGHQLEMKALCVIAVGLADLHHADSAAIGNCYSYQAEARRRSECGMEDVPITPGKRWAYDPRCRCAERFSLP